MLKRVCGTILRFWFPDPIGIVKTASLTLVFIFLFLRFTSDVYLHSFNPDEHDFVDRARYFDLLFLKGDIRNNAWQSDAAYDQPLLAPYIYGIFLHLVGIKDIAEEQERVGFSLLEDNRFVDVDNEPWWIHFRFINPYDFPEEYRQAIGMIMIARKGAIIFSIGSLILIYFLGSALDGGAVGICSMLLLGLNRLMFLTGRRAMGDSVLLFFCLATVVLLTKITRYFYRKNLAIFLISCVGLGVLEALAASAKLNGGMTIIFTTLVFFIFFIRVGRKPRTLSPGMNANLFQTSDSRGKVSLRVLSTLENLKQIPRSASWRISPRKFISTLKKKLKIAITPLTFFIGIIINFVVSFNLFVVLNPYLYPNPLSNSIRMVKHRVNESKFQIKIQPENSLDNSTKKINYIFHRTLMSNFINSYYGYNLFNYNNFDIYGLDILLFGFGLSLMVLTTFKKVIREKSISKEVVVFLWVVFSFVCLYVYIPLDWDRYYLPIIPSIALVQAYAIIKIVVFITRILKERIIFKTGVL